MKLTCHPLRSDRLQHSLHLLSDQRWLPYLLLACMMTGCAVHLSHWRWATFLDHLVLNVSFNMRGSQDPAAVAEKLPGTRDIIIVELNHEVPRPILSKLLVILRQAKVVAFDLMFVNHEAELKEDEKSWYAGNIKEWSREDRQYADEFRRSGRVVVGMWPEKERAEDPKRPGRYIERRIWQKPAAQLWHSARYQAHLWVTPDAQDSMVRRVPIFQNTPERTPCLGLAIAAAASGISPEQLKQSSSAKGYLQLGPRRIPLDDNGLMLIDYVGGRQCFEYDTNRIVYQRVLQMSPPEDFKGKIVIIGETDFKSKDIFTTPFGDMAGLQVHANVVATLLSPQGPPSVVPPWQRVFVALICGVLLIVPLLRLPLWSSFLVAVGEVVFVVLGAAWIFCRFHQVLPVSMPVIAIALTYNAIALYEYARTRSTLGRFIGHEMVPRTMHIFSRLRLGGRTEEASAFFCDLRGYSTLSERLPPETVTQILNDYTNTVVSVVRKHRGRPIDYLGDGVFVLFEESLAGKNHAVEAVNAALETGETIAQHRQQWEAVGASPLKVGIGIHSGQVVIGVVGAEQHMKLGAVGDVVNVAARVQGLSQQCEYDVLITSDTYERVRSKIAAVYCGSFPVKGREQPVEVYGVGSPAREVSQQSSIPGEPLAK